jgi:hypothetical protein
MKEKNISFVLIIHIVYLYTISINEIVSIINDNGTYSDLFKNDLEGSQHIKINDNSSHAHVTRCTSSIRCLPFCILLCL